jgi:methanogenic corrinoid protein MtbC1
MSAVTDAPAALQRYEQAVANGDRRQIVCLVDDLLADGVAPLDVLTGVVAAAQREIGLRWQRGEWSVAQEHAATAMAMAATEVIADRIAQTSPTRGQVIVTCAEREWHWLPAAIVSSALRADGWETKLLGPATSPLRLSQYVQDLGPEAVAVSCSVLGAVPTSRRFIEASTSAGVPVIVGGSAFGSDDVRARALGATAWAADADGAVDAMTRLPVAVAPAPPLPQAAAQEQAALALDHSRLVARIQRQWTVTADSAAHPAQAAMRAVARDALSQPLHAVAVAVLTDDPRPVAETAAWIADLLRNRDVDPGPAVEDLAAVLCTTLIDYPLSVGVIREHFALR